MEMKDFRLDGKIALVTGASYGIGFAIANGFAKAGATIVFNDINQDLVNKGLEAYKEAGIKAHGYVCDVTDEDGVNAMVAKIEKEVGVIDILVNNAGIIKRIPMCEMTAAQIKKALDLTVKLGGRGYVFWGGREGYETLLNTDVEFETENIARLMRMAVDYGRSIGFEGDFYIEPKPKEPMKHQYDFDASTAIGFLKAHGLDKDFKMNIEANHATLAGHTFQHELRISAINGMLGSIDANQGDLLLGWDTDEFPFNVYEATLCMYEVLKAGGLTGGFNFDAKCRRPSYTAEDMFAAYILGMDTFALGLIKAAALIEDGRLDEAIRKKYSYFKENPVGLRILGGQCTLKELSDYAEKLGKPELPASGNQEILQNIVNGVLFGGK